MRVDGGVIESSIQPIVKFDPSFLLFILFHLKTFTYLMLQRVNEWVPSYSVLRNLCANTKLAVLKWISSKADADWRCL